MNSDYIYCNMKIRIQGKKKNKVWKFERIKKTKEKRRKKKAQMKFETRQKKWNIVFIFLNGCSLAIFPFSFVHFLYSMLVPPVAGLQDWATSPDDYVDDRNRTRVVQHVKLWHELIRTHKDKEIITSQSRKSRSSSTKTLICFLNSAWTSSLLLPVR